MPKLPAVAAAVGLAGGLVLAHALFGAPLWLWYVLGAAATLALATVYLCKRAALGALALVVVFMGLGAVLYSIHAYDVPDIPAGRYVLYGTVREVHTSRTGMADYLLSGAVIETQEGTRAQLEGKTYLRGVPGDEIVMPGQMLAIRGASVSVSEGPSNPGGFNAKMYGFSKGYHYIAYAQESTVGIGKERAVASAVLRVRLGALEAIDALWPMPEENAIMRAMLLGDTATMQEEQNDAFSRLGIAHILAVSGLHVGFVVLLLGGMLKIVFHCLPRRYSWLWDRFRWGRAAFLMIGLFFYAAVTGFTPSTLRALLMAYSMQIAQACAVRPNRYSTLCAAVAAMLIARPMDIFSGSFQLSVSAVGGILLYGPAFQEKILRLKAPRVIAESLAVTASAQIGVIPLLARSFNQIPVLGLLANLFAVPLSGFLTMAGLPILLLYIASPAIAAIPAYPVALCARLLSRLAITSAKIPLISLEVPSPPVVLMALHWAIVLLCAPDVRRLIGAMWKKLLMGLSAGVAVCAALWVIALFPPVPVLTMLNAGQGHSTMIRHGTRAVLIDTGASGASYNASMYYGTRYDAVFITHGDADHALALARLIREGRVLSLYVPQGIDTQKEAVQEAFAAAVAAGIPVQSITAGDVVSIGGMTVAAHAPVPGRWEWGENAYMLVCSVSISGRTEALFPGDLSISAERDILFPSARVLQVAHHGSGSSTSDGFLNIVRPELALIPVGKNTYGHPNEELLERLEAADAHVERTDRSGAVEVTLGDQLRVKTWRKER